RRPRAHAAWARPNTRTRSAGTRGPGSERFSFGVHLQGLLVRLRLGERLLRGLELVLRRGRGALAVVGLLLELRGQRLLADQLGLRDAAIEDQADVVPLLLGVLRVRLVEPAAEQRGL